MKPHAGMSAISYQQSDASYRADPGQAQSYVKHILKSPAHYKAALGRKFSPTLSMQIGSALHCLVLEGEEQFNRDFILKPDDISLTTVKGKEWRAENKGKTILSKTDQFASWDAVHGMADSLRRLEWFNPNQKDYRKFNELSLYWEADELDCKCRLDRLILEDDKAIILDLKTTDSVDSKDFLKKVIGSMNYLFQAAWYVEGTQAAFKVPASFVFVGIERTAPYATKVFEISEEMIWEGLQQTTAARQLLVECQRGRHWEPPAIEHEVLTLPPWFASPVASAKMMAEQAETNNALDVFEVLI
ncbi:MAG: PD-(D/E)XK nuclease-like domain-containing protein [Polynucleobacter sp.]